MESLVYVPTYEVFVILEAFRERFREHLEAIRPLLVAAEEGPLLIGADCYYREATDVALVAMRLDERTLSKAKLTAVIAMAQAADRPLLDPRRLSDDDRRSFYRDYLVLYAQRAEDCSSLREAIHFMGGKLGLITAAADDNDAFAVGTESWPVEPVEKKTTRPYGAGPADIPAPARVPHIEDLLPPKPIGKNRQAERAETVPGSSRARQVTPPVPHARKFSAPQPSAPVVNVRFLRGDTWMPGRLRALNMKDARVATSAPPRLGDPVQLAVGLDDLGVVVHGVAVESQTGDVALESGFAGFAMEFPELSDDAHGQLRSLLIRARERGLSLTPPPPRAAVRFPLNWPVRIVSGASKLSLTVLDISRRGLFVAAHAPLPDTEIEFQLPDELGGLPINGRARVVREVTAEMAQSRGLDPGYGLTIIELSDTSRYERFVDRVGRRCETRILVGASRARATALTWDLAALGYSVATTTDPAEAARAVNGGARPPDLAILDDSLTCDDMEAQLVRKVFIGRKVPCIAIHGANPDKTRAAVDELLSVG